MGEFYEAFGLDALMLVQHAGLNPMGGKCRAGCPVQNLQATLDDLTSAGLTVAVYEEFGEAPKRGDFGNLKQRALAQVVSPASPVYMYEACLSPHQIPYAGEPPPVVGVCASASGFSLCSVHVDSRTWRLHQRLSAPALAALLAARAHAPPLLVNDLSTALPTAVLSHTSRRSLHAPTPADFPRAVLEHVAGENELSVTSFRQLPTRGEARDAPPTPIYLSTATQIGLLPAAGIPDLVRALLPSDAPAACAQLLRRWLLLPPRPSVADAMRAACAELLELRAPLPAARPTPVGKLVGLLLARQANAPFFGELKQLLGALHAALSRSELGALNDALLALVAEEAGLRLAPDLLAEEAAHAIARIDGVVAAPSAAAEDTHSVDPSGRIPDAFFSRNEHFRALLRPEVAAAEYAELGASAEALCEAVAADTKAFGLTHAAVHDLINNAIHLRPMAEKEKKAARAARAAEEAEEVEEAQEAEAAKATKAAKAAASKDAVAANTGPTTDTHTDASTGANTDAGDGDARLGPARDRNKRLLPNRFVSSRVHASTERYLAACEDAECAVKGHLQRLCDALKPQLPTLTTAAHWVLLSATLSAHVGHALEQQWVLPTLKPAADANRALELDAVWPYWLPRRSATPNSLSWDGLWLLTAPNMAGKSSLMRSMLVASLLANSGLLAPVAAARVPRYDAYFLQTASFDAPAEGKSAFAQEMDDLHVIASEGTRRSLIMLDELGRGTSTTEGAALSAALLEWLDGRGICAVFATHLHEIEHDLARMPPIRSLSRRCLPVSEADDGSLVMTFQLAEGVCRDSLALRVAHNAGLPAALLSRAEALMAAATEAAQRGDGEHEGAGQCKEGADRAFADAGAAADADGGRCEQEGRFAGISAEEQLRVASQVLRELSGSDDVVHVAANWQPPPRLSGRSCVYLLQLGDAQADADTSLYVGESDHIARRLEQHRRRHGKRTVECVLVEVPSKSAARELEALTIKSLKALRLGRVRNVAKA